MPNRPLILCVEDDPNDVYFIKRVFSFFLPSYDLITFDNADSAIAFLNDLEEHAIPNLAILDIKLISGTGFEVLKFIKTHATLKNIPAVMMSSSDRQDDKKVAATIGCDAYFEKLRTYEELKKELPIIVKKWVKEY